MKFFDAHADTISEIFDHKKNLLENDLHIDAKRLSAYNSYTQIFAVFISPKYKECAMERAKKLIEAFYIETKACDIATVKNNVADAKIRAILSLEGGEPIKKLSDIRELYKLGVRMIAPTWNYKNKIACGILEKEDTGLSEFGKSVIYEMERLGIICDCSHLSEKSFWDVVEISSKPLVASHSNSFFVKNNPRNLTDKQFLAIKNSGGCVGINFYPPFLGDKIEDAILHIEHFLALGGEDNIGIGSDFDGVDALPCRMMGCQDMESFIKMLPYTTELREKIAYKNFLRVIKAHNC